MDKYGLIIKKPLNYFKKIISIIYIYIYNESNTIDI